MTRKGLWPTLERLPSLEAVLAEWQDVLGKDFSNAEPFLIPTNRHSPIYPCTNKSPCGCYHEIIKHPSGRIIAACRCETRECKTILLQSKDSIIYALDSQKFSKAIQNALNFIANGSASSATAQNRWLVGTHGDTHSPVYFLAKNSEDDFLKGLEDLINAGSVPFILLTPSNQFRTQGIQTILQRQKATMIPLAPALSFKSPGKFSISQSIQPVLEQFKQGLTEGKTIIRTSQEKTITPIPLPSGAKWEDITIEFADGHNLNIKCKGKTFRRDYKEMGFEDSKSRKPNKQWEFLNQLANSQGEIAWEKSSSRKAVGTRRTEQDFGYEYDEDDSSTSQNKGFSIIKAPDKTKKIKQLLSQTLKTAFQIQSDPFFPYRKAKAYKIRLKLVS